MTRKGEQIREKILYYLERNPDGLKLGTLQNLIKVSRNSLYRYLFELQNEGYITRGENKLWTLRSPIKPQTIPGYQYQAILQGLAIIGGKKFDISTSEGRTNFKNLGKRIYEKLKIPELDIEHLKRRAHKSKEIMEYAMKLLQEAKTVERFKFIEKFESDGFPERDSNLAAVITFEGGYIASDPVRGNGFAHYYIISGILEAFAERIIIPLYGGRVSVNIIKLDEEKQIVDLGVFVIFDEKTPYREPRTGKLIANPRSWYEYRR